MVFHQQAGGESKSIRKEAKVMQMMRLYFAMSLLVLVSNSGCSSHVDYESIDSLKRRPEFRATVDEVLIRDEYTPGKTFAMLTLRLANGSKINVGGAISTSNEEDLKIISRFKILKKGEEYSFPRALLN